jgi:23S rRNA (adenine2503-C2)-methyltransferase
MKIVAKTGNPDLAQVYIAKFGESKLVEFVESLEPPFPKNDKWVLIVSTLYGCPVKCKFCDSGEFYKGKLTKEEILSQVDYLVRQYYPDGVIPVKKFKIQFARMGEPAFNNAVLDAMEEIPGIYKVPGFLPSISTIAPKGTESWFERLKEIKDKNFPLFQMQFSIHTTNEEQRNWLMPVKKWSFDEIARYGERFYKTGERKITLNFALAENMELNPEVLINHFNPDVFLVKITPVNPTFKALKNHLESSISPKNDIEYITDGLKSKGYDVLISIGEIEENNIGSNCGQHILNYLNCDLKVNNSYTYELEKIG